MKKLYPGVILKKGKEEPVRRSHPWIFSGAIGEIKGAYQEGDIAEVFSHSGEYLATGYLLSGSIAVKLFTYQKQEITPAFWKQKIQKAFDLRASLGLTSASHTNTYRLVHNEGDGMPGLVIDIYGKCAVLQSHSVGMYQLRELFRDALLEIYGSRLECVYDKSSDTLRKMTGFSVKDEFLYGNTSEFEVLEQGHSFHVNVASGQKTGFFVDQRDNRGLLAKYASSRKVLNLFAYTGGFSVYALKAGATLVHTVDSSASAMGIAEKNLQLNHFDPSAHACIIADAKQYLESVAPGTYDLMILDPPAYAKNVSNRNQALSGYRSLNALAMKKIGPRGIIFTFSCSQVVDRQMFTNAVTAAAIDSGRKVQVIGHLSQPADHPINIFHQEGEYLKGLVLMVE